METPLVHFVRSHMIDRTFNRTHSKTVSLFCRCERKMNWKYWQDAFFRGNTHHQLKLSFCVDSTYTESNTRNLSSVLCVPYLYWSVWILNRILDRRIDRTYSISTFRKAKGAKFPCLLGDNCYLLRSYKQFSSTYSLILFQR